MTNENDSIWAENPFEFGHKGISIEIKCKIIVNEIEKGKKWLSKEERKMNLICLFWIDKWQYKSMLMQSVFNQSCFFGVGVLKVKYCLFASIEFSLFFLFFFS